MPPPEPHAAKVARRYPLSLTLAELGLCIDGLAKLVGPDDREAAELLHDLQRLGIIPFTQAESRHALDTRPRVA